MAKKTHTKKVKKKPATASKSKNRTKKRRTATNQATSKARSARPRTTNAKKAQPSPAPAVTKTTNIRQVSTPNSNTSYPTATPAPPAPSPAPTTEQTPPTIPPTEAQLRKIKSGLRKRDLDRYYRQLLEKRAELLGDVAALENDAFTDSGDRLSPEHMADVGSSNYEQEFTLSLVESEQRLLREIDEALLRIQNGTYGVCAETGEPIGKPRLDAKPWAKYCIDVARGKERTGQL